MTVQLLIRLSLTGLLATALGAESNPAEPPSPALKPLTEKPALSFINDESPRWLSLSGELQFRFEDRRSLDFRDGNDDSYGLFRTRINIAVKPTSWLQFQFQGQDARAPGKRSAIGIFRDPFDVRQAYVKIGGGENQPVAVSVGRQLLSYGDQRLIGALDWTNTSRTFDAAKLEWSPRSDVKLDLFSASVVQNDPTRRVNPSAEGNNLHGFYGSIKNLIPRSVIEPYAFWQTTPTTVNELGFTRDLDRYSGGVRIWGKGLGRWDYNLAVIKQWGEMAGADIGAWGSYAELGYSIPTQLDPRLYVEYTFGSGDSDPSDGKIGGFVDLFPTVHLWYGYNDLVGWRNLKNVRLGAEFKPHRKLGLRVDFHQFRLANRNDGLYNAAGFKTVAAQPGGAVDTKIGDELDATVSVSLTPTFIVGGGLGHLFPGSFLERYSAGHGNTFTFVFSALKF